MMNDVKKYVEYREKSLNILSELRKPNGVFRASTSEHYNSTWIRDNYWCNQSYINNEELYTQTCHTHLDFLHKYENGYDHKISWLKIDNDVHGVKEYRFLHPKVNFNGDEIKGLQWRFIQIDTLFYYLLMFYNGFKKNYKVFRNENDIAIVQLLIKAIENLEMDTKLFSHAWEENIDLFTSNLGLGINALEGCYEMGFDVDRDYVRRLKIKFYEQFPNETKERNWDLTLLFLCTLDDFLSPMEIEDIVKGITLNLEREYGVLRYIDDIYKPFDNTSCKDEMQWVMGFGYLSIIYSKSGNKDMAKYYLDKIVNTYKDGLIPEGVNELGESCYNTPLAWSISMTIQAIDQILKL